MDSAAVACAGSARCAGASRSSGQVRARMAGRSPAGASARPGVPRMQLPTPVLRRGVCAPLYSNACAIAAAVVLYGLSLAVLRHEKAARLAALMFAATPAAVFFSAIYSEAPFALAAWAGLWALEAGQPAADGAGKHAARTLAASACFAAAGFVRSNAIVMAGFLGWSALRRVHSLRAAGQLTWLAWVTGLATLGVGICITVAPFPLVQWLGGMLYCGTPPAGLASFWRSAGLPLPAAFPTAAVADGASRPWCPGAPAQDWAWWPLPGLYGHVQRAYWNVGPFRYWEVKQIPNFVLAAPVMLATAAAARRAVQLEYVRRLPALVWAAMPPLCGSQRAAGAASDSAWFRAAPAEAAEAWWCWAALPYYMQWCALAGIALISMHVQVSTRFIASSCPALYWALAAWWTHGTSGTRRAIAAWCIGYAVVGTALFTTFYPWT